MRRSNRYRWPGRGDRIDPAAAAGVNWASPKSAQGTISICAIMPVDEWSIMWQWYMYRPV